MRREKRLAENEERYRAEQDRRRAKRNRDSSPVARQPDGGDSSVGRRASGGRASGRYETADSPSVLSASER
jgi:hypothetical protein